MTSNPVKIVFGGAAIGPGMAMDFPDEESIEKVYQLLERGGCSTIDTARAYPGSEEWMGKTGAGKRFTIDSKTPGGLVRGTSTGKTIPQHAKETVERLGIESVDVYYIHVPDSSVDLEDQLKGISTAYAMGYFKRFGLSNFSVEDVQRVYDICKAKGYPLPTVYQGHYNALGIAFYVYGPIAGGLLTKTPKQLRDGAEAGRFAKGHSARSTYAELYDKPSYYTALEMAELAYRWVAFDSIVDSKYGDAVIFGASSYTQIEQTLGWLRKGSVGAAAKAKIEEIWKVVEHEAPLHHWEGPPQK
ncbi:Aldehyde reductase [Mycena sanguinolenta]|uniref:Aldehyde reductase n=1 Tax=Mycena sanguinolenta TaxID=230812 RepID=A0A8H7DMU2_9AGAR|nr:Aldehyde reductase [Mycena sanguinolenta]